MVGTGLTGTISPADLTYLTNGYGADTGNVDLTVFDGIGLGYGLARDPHYPLTEKESRYTCGRLACIGGEVCARLGYTVFFKGRKWLAPKIDIRYQARRNDFDRSLPTQFEARWYAGMLSERLGVWAKTFGGHVVYAEPIAPNLTDLLEIVLLVPPEYASKEAPDGLAGWVDHLASIALYE